MGDTLTQAETCLSCLLLSSVLMLSSSIRNGYTFYEAQIYKSLSLCLEEFFGKLEMMPCKRFINLKKGSHQRI